MKRFLFNNSFHYDEQSLQFNAALKVRELGGHIKPFAEERVSQESGGNDGDRPYARGGKVAE